MYAEKEVMLGSNLDKCPACGGVLAWDENTGKIICQFCAHTFAYEELKHDILPDMEEDEEYDEYRCGDCGGVIVTDANSITSSCPYCGNTSIIKNRIAGKYYPDYIIPFRITVEQAKENFMQVLHYRMTTRSFKKQFRLEEVSSLFVPFWLYNTDISAEITYEHIQYDKKGTPRTRRKNTRFTESYDKVPVDASLKLDDDKMDRIEPYDYSQLKAFHPSYFIGHKAERYDTDAGLMSERAKKKIEKSAKTSFSRYLYEHPSSSDGALFYTMGAADQVTTKVVKDMAKAMGAEDYLTGANSDFDSEYLADNANIGRIKKAKIKADLSDYRYALFPVYLIRGKYRGKNYLYYVNGQTGKVAANFPFGYLEYYLNRIAGTLVGSLFVGGVFFFGARCFMKLWEQNNTMPAGGFGISGGRLFLIAWAVAFLFLYILETKYNGKESLREARASTGEVAIVPNAKNFRVPGTFKIAKQ